MVVRSNKIMLYFWLALVANDITTVFSIKRDVVLTKNVEEFPQLTHKREPSKMSVLPPCYLCKNTTVRDAIEFNNISRHFKGKQQNISTLTYTCVFYCKHDTRVYPSSYVAFYI